MYVSYVYACTQIILAECLCKSDHPFAGRASELAPFAGRASEPHKYLIMIHARARARAHTHTHIFGCENLGNLDYP